jgi:hypothetical protein
MGIDFYLFEMPVSDRYGGGLTLQRVLGGDLDRIRLFAHISRFARDFPQGTAWAARFSWSETARPTTEVYRKVVR